jgi:hypothetical protein
VRLLYSPARCPRVIVRLSEKIIETIEVITPGHAQKMKQNETLLHIHTHIHAQIVRICESKNRVFTLAN